MHLIKMTENIPNENISARVHRVMSSSWAGPTNVSPFPKFLARRRERKTLTVMKDIRYGLLRGEIISVSN